MPKRLNALFALLLLTAVLLSSCGNNIDKYDFGHGCTDQAWDPLCTEGDIVIAGSSTVFPLAEALIDRFEEEGYEYRGTVTYDSIGSGGGFERFCVTGETDIAGASRPIKDKEIASCTAIDRVPIEFRVGTDALAIVVSAENDFVDNLTLEEVALVFGSAETWADVNPAWPDKPIDRYTPGTDSGTFDFFIEAIFDKDQTRLADTQQSEDDNVLVTGVTGSPYGVAFFGYAYYIENADILKVLSIDGVEPTRENVDAAAYSLARPLYIYSDAQIIQEKPQVATFIRFFLSFTNEEIIDAGYFPASETDLAAAIEAWHTAVGDEGISEE